jgi:hypothetical protein
MVVDQPSIISKLFYSEFIFLGYMLGSLKNSVNSFEHFFLIFFIPILNINKKLFIYLKK